MKPKAIILGAGITGLSAAWKLSEQGYEVIVFESNNFLGGMASTFDYKDCKLDFGPHKIFTVMPHIQKEIENLFADDELLKIKKTSKVRLRGKYLNFPLSFIDIFGALGIGTGIKCGFGYGWSILKNIFSKSKVKSYEDWVVTRFGYPVYNLVLRPFASKIWGNPKELSKDLAQSRIASPSLFEMIWQMIFKRKKNRPVINAEYFQYPKKGFIEISNKMAKKINDNEGKIFLNNTIKDVLVENNLITKIIDYKNIEYVITENDLIINTIPLQNLVSVLRNFEINNIQDILKQITYRRLILFYLVVNKDFLIPENWLFFPEEKYSFNRVYEQKAFNKEMVPNNKTVVCFEITCDPTDELWKMTDQQLYSKIIHQIMESKIISSPDIIIEYFTKRIENGYPVYTIPYKNNIDFVLKELNQIENLYSIGRQGSFSYTGMADSMDIGISTAEFIISKQEKSTKWIEFKERFYNYVVVD